MNPYLVLGLPPEADDQTIRQAYLKAVKEASPDTHPERFQVVSQAYEKIKDEASRRQHLLFHGDCPGASPLDTLARYASHHHFEPLPFAAMQELLRSLAKPAGK